MTGRPSIFGPLFFGGIYFAVRQGWPGTIWLVAVAIYVLGSPLIFAIRSDRRAAAST